MEKLVPLTSRDHEKLKAAKGGGTGCFLIFVFALLIVSGLIYLLANDLFAGSFLLGGMRLPSGIAVVPFSLIFIVIAFLIYRRYGGTTKKDIASGMKNVVTSAVLKQYTQELDPQRRTKFANTTAYIVDINGTQYDVKERDYAKFKEGMPVEVHTAVHSGEFLGIYDPNSGKLLSDELF